MRFASTFFSFGLIFSAMIAHAADLPSLAPEPLLHDDTPAYVFSLGVGGGRHADDGVVQLRPGFHVRLNNTHLGKNGRLFGMDSKAPFAVDIVAPMHLTVKDRGVEDAVWRSTEYDEASEFFSLLKRVEYGRLDGPWYMRLGGLSDIRLGHGTILQHFQSNYRYDERNWGLHLKLQSPVAGGEFLLDDILEPGLIAARLFTTPWARADSAARGIGFGVSMAGDFFAPTALELDENGNMRFDAKRRAEVKERTDVAMLGLDVEAQVVHTPRTRMTFYSDVNLLFPHASAGWHTGATLAWKSGEKSIFVLRGEFILRGKGYIPRYFDRAYTISRVRIAAPWMPPIPLAQFRDAMRDDGLHTGYSVEARWQHSVAGDVTIGVDGGSGAFDEALFVQYASPEVYPVRVALRYELPWIESWQRMHLFEQAAISAQMQVSITPWLSAWAQAERHWRQSTENTFAPETSVQAGMTFYYALRR